MANEIVVGGGCFWCIEAAFKELEGVETVVSGYAGGRTDNPSYREVCSGDTGHAEVIKINYDQEKISLERILELFFKLHNPTTKNREGPDIGSQYRSIILYQTEHQKKAVEKFIKNIQRDYSDEIVTDVRRLDKFYLAEEEHQDYFKKNPENAYCRINAQPKVEKAKNF